MTTVLNTIQFPDNLRRLPLHALQQVANELRMFVLDSVSKTGGHLSSNLGSVELAIALHYVFDTPHDRIIWDVGHQSYPHKILTGRRDAMASIRQFGGISGFPRRTESEYDVFGTAHSSTSISAALGMAHAARLKRVARHCVAVIGDGALSAGMALEALNNVGTATGLPLIVLLNDNNMSISPSVGALRDALGRLTEMRHAGPATLFEEFGLSYAGPIDGHDVVGLVGALEALKSKPGPHLLHVLTQKGHGYARAQADPIQYHGPGKFDPAAGVCAGKPGRPTYTQVFSDWLCDEAAHDDRVVAITPAMREGSGLVEFERRFPDRYFDVAIAEQHAITFAAGLAAEGMRPVVAIYSTFLQRGYDQLIHDVALQNLPVTFAIDRAGIVGADGATHMGAFDIAYLRCIPNLVVMSPSNENECRQMLHTALHQPGPCAVRYPRGAGPGTPIEAELTTLPVGVSLLCRSSGAADGRRIAFLAFGTMVAPCLDAAEFLDATVVDMRFVKPLDTLRLSEIAVSHDVLVTAEEGCLHGGAGAACLEALADLQLSRPVLRLGLPDCFIEHGEQARLLSLCGLDAESIRRSVEHFVARIDAMNASAAMTQEHVILVDTNDVAVGVCEKMQAHREGLLHRAFSIFVFDDRGRLLLQQRAFDKYHSGGLWSNTCCGHPRPDEALLDATRRRLFEEMGFTCALREVDGLLYCAAFCDGLVEHEFLHIYAGSFNGAFVPEPGEVTAWRWVDVPTLAGAIDACPDSFTAWFRLIVGRVGTAGIAGWAGDFVSR